MRIRKVKKCQVVDRTKGYCFKHYREHLYTLAPKCIVKNCINNSKSKKTTICDTHYQRKRLYGNVDYATPYEKRPAIVEGDIAKIPLGVNAKDGYAIVDKDFAHLADEYKFHIISTGYAQNNDCTKLHHIIIGKPETGKVVDHINRDKLDNRKSNLRHITYSQNIHNAKFNGSSGYKGVSLTKNKSRWRAYIKPYKKQINLGVFNTKEEAAKAYNEAAKHYFGEYAYINPL